MRGFQPDILAPFPKRSQTPKQLRRFGWAGNIQNNSNQKSKFDLYNFLWYNRDAVVEHTAYGFDFKFDFSFRFHIHLDQININISEHWLNLF